MDGAYCVVRFQCSGSAGMECPTVVTFSADGARDELTVLWRGWGPETMLGGQAFVRLALGCPWFYKVPPETVGC
jgi:hypothetical protein